MGKHLIAVFVLVVLILLCAGCSPEPRPQDYAAARQIDVSTQATATAAAGQAVATSTAVAWQAKATDTAWTLSVQATQTAVPLQSPRVAASASNEIARDWIFTIALAGLWSVLILIGLAGVYFARNRAEQMPRDVSGQLPGVLRGGVVTDPQRMIGPAIALPRTDLVWQIARVVRYFRTGNIDPLPSPQFALTDGGADADHLLAAAQSANQVSGIAAMFQPGVTHQVRQERIEIVKRGARAIGGIQVAPPQTRVMLPGGDTQMWMRAIASAFDVEPKALVAGTAIEGEFVSVDETDQAEVEHVG